MKSVDKWKSKSWYTVKAPIVFESKSIGEVAASDPKRLVDRKVSSSLFDLGMGSSSQIAMFTTLNFRIKSVNGSDASTILLGHEISPSFIKTFARRGKSLIHQVVDEKTKDEKDLRVKIIAVTGARVSENTRRNLRAILIEETKKAIAEKPCDEVMMDIVHGRFSSKLFSRLKQITKMRRVEIRKSELGEIFK